MNQDKPAGSGLPREIADAKSDPLKFDPQDPTTAAAVQEFLADKTSEFQAEAPPGSAAPEVKAPGVNLTPNAEFDSGDPKSTFISEALSPIDKIEISEEEKIIFLKAVLADVPVRLPVKLYGGRMTVEMRSRSAFEQKRVFDVLKLDEKEAVFDPGDMAMMITRTHYYLGALMIERINGELFSELTIPPGNDLAADAAKMRAAVDKLFLKMGNVKWTSILNALRIFEHKCAKLNSEAANEGFWNPQGSA